MVDGVKRQQHFILTQSGNPQPYTYNGTTPRNKVLIPTQERAVQAAKLNSQLTLARQAINQIAVVERQCEVTSPTSVQLLVKSFDGVEMPFESLGDARQKIEILKSIKRENVIETTIAVPENGFKVWEKKLSDYTSSKKDVNGKARDGRKLIDSIAEISAVTLENLWAEAKELFPQNHTETYWWEVWLPRGDNRDLIFNDFRKLSAAYGIESSSRYLKFPERTVLTIRASVAQLREATALLVRIAELRLHTETADFYINLSLSEQRDWSKELLQRLSLSRESNTYVCILDTGVTNGHPLLKPFLEDQDQFAIDPDWHPADDEGHGTGMAGLVVWGDLIDHLGSDSLVNISHRIESVKVLRHDGDNEGKHLGLITSDGIALPEIANAQRNRVFVMALTKKVSKNIGAPSAWSAVLDGLISDETENGKQPRLILVSAGNAPTDLMEMMNYPAYNHDQEVHDPGQSWNAITIGAYTNKTYIDKVSFPNYSALAPAGSLSPYSSTTHQWDLASPLKPEVVFEGGNIGIDQLSCAGLDSLHLMTTSNEITDRQYTSFSSTSAATALAGNFCAQLMEAYPQLWPETIRGLMIHSASWTESMYRAAAPFGSTLKQRAQHLMRNVGYGVPNLAKALWTLNNCLTLIVQDEIQPFTHHSGKVSTKDMHVHQLPWPKEQLESLGAMDVTMTVTLSYFIEPNPGARYSVNKYRYGSHQLRFDLKRPLESTEDFKSRISAAAEDGSGQKTTDSKWILGNFRNKGSIHKDVWQGSAADLAARDHIIVYPANGWWRLRPSEGKVERKSRYALLITIETSSQDIDLITEVEAKLKLPVATNVLI